MTSRAQSQLWDSVRLLVLDLETMRAPDKSHRIVSIAVVTCRGGKVTEEWSSLVNPGFPIDPKTQEKHHLTDDDVKDAPPFARVAPDLAPLLLARRGEAVAVVAHNVNFDIPVLRDEMARVGEAIPDLPVIDTMRRLAAVAGFPGRRPLAGLAALLGLTNAAPHTALGDAKVTAEAACALFNLAAEAGHTSFEALLDELADGRTTDLLRATPGDFDDEMPEPVLPAGHVASHAIEQRPSKARRAVTAWLDSVVECATLLCPSLGDRLDEVCPLRPDLFTGLAQRLVALAKSGNKAVTATLLGALMTHFEEIPPSATGRRQQAVRAAATAFDAEAGPLFDGLRRCADPWYCPACRRNEPCPLDVWRLHLARAVIGNPENTAKSFFWTNGSNAGGGVYAAMRAAGFAPLADASLRLVHRHWLTTGSPATAEDLARLAVEGPCRDPEVAEAYATTIAAAGRQADLETALQLCDAVRALDTGSLEEGWRRLSVRRAEIGGRLRRLSDNDRHQAKIQVRVRPPRFQRRAVPIPTAGIEISAE